MSAHSLNQKHINTSFSKWNILVYANFRLRPAKYTMNSGRKVKYPISIFFVEKNALLLKWKVCPGNTSLHVLSNVISNSLFVSKAKKNRIMNFQKLPKMLFFLLRSYFCWYFFSPYISTSLGNIPPGRRRTTSEVNKQKK